MTATHFTGEVPRRRHRRLRRDRLRLRHGLNVPRWRRLVRSLYLRVGAPGSLAGFSSASIVFFVLFRTGEFIATIDVSPMVVDGLSKELGWQWTHQNSGAGGPTYEIARAVEVLAVQIARLLGGTETLGQRLLFSAIWGFAAAGGATLAARFTKRRWLAAMLGMVATFNPYTMVAQPNPLPIISIGVAAFVLALSIDAARGKKQRWVWLALLTLPCSYLSVNPPLLALLLGFAAAQPVLAPLVASGGNGSVRRVLWLLIRSGPVAVGLNLWWLVPVVIAMRHTDPTTVHAVTDVKVWSWTHSRSSLQNVFTLYGHWSWPKPEYFGTLGRLERMPWRPMRWVLPILALFSPLCAGKQRRRPGIVLAILVGLCVFVSKGLHRPFPGANQWLYDNVPGFWLFREPAAKITVITVLLYVIGAAITIDAVIRWFEQRTFVGQFRGRGKTALKRVVGLLLVVIPLLGVWPLWTGAVIKSPRDGRPGDRSSLPPDWRRVASAINTSALHGKTLVLPIDDYYQLPTTWGYYGADNLVRRLVTRPVIQSNPQLYVGDSAVFEQLMHSVEEAVTLNGGKGVPPILRTLGVSHIVVRKDIDFSSPMRVVKMARPEAILAGLAHVEGLQSTLRTSVADVFELVDRPGGAVEALGGIVTTGDLAAGGLGSLRSAVPDGLTLASKSDIPGLIAGSATVMGSSSDSIAKDLGSNTTWTMSRHTASAPLFRARIAGDSLRVEESVSWKIGNVGSADSTALVPRQYETVIPGLVGAAIAGRYVDRADAGSLFRADSATTAVPYLSDGPGVDGQRSSLGAMQGPIDCHNYDRSAPEVLAFGVEKLPGTGGFELRASRHSACLRFEVIGVKPGATFRVRVAGKSESGSAPRFCLWVKGVDKCAALNPFSGGGTLTSSNIWQVPPAATSAALYLYADEAKFGIQSVVHYDVPIVERVHSLKSIVVPIGQGYPQTVHINTAAPPVNVSVDAPEPSVTRYSGVGDCHRTDQRSMAAVGIRGEEIDAGIRLFSNDHSGCVSVPIDDLDPGLRYTLSFEHRTLRGEKARFCLLDPSTKKCLAGRTIEDSGLDWQIAEAKFDAPSQLGVVPLLFVYADGAESGRTATEYRNFRVRSSVDEYVTMVSKDTVSRARPTMSFDEISPARYRVKITRATSAFVVALSDTWSADWKISGLPKGVRVDHLRIDGYRNGWAIDGRGNLEMLIEYVPARIGQRAIQLSLATAALVIAGWAVGVAIRRWRVVALRRRPRLTV